MSKLTKRMEKLALLAGSSFKTVHARLRIAERLSQHLKSSHIESYVMARREAKITPPPPTILRRSLSPHNRGLFLLLNS